MHPALYVTCPICKRIPGQICARSNGTGLWGKPHQSRKDLAARELKEKADGSPTPHTADAPGV